MKLNFGQGNIWVTTFGDKKGNYGVAFRIVPGKHIINDSDPSVVGKTFDDVPHDLYMEFSKSQSVQVVINKLAMVRDDLRAAEQSAHPTRESLRSKKCRQIKKVLRSPRAGNANRYAAPC